MNLTGSVWGSCATTYIQIEPLSFLCMVIHILKIHFPFCGEHKYKTLVPLIAPRHIKFDMEMNNQHLGREAYRSLIADFTKISWVILEVKHGWAWLTYSVFILSISYKNTQNISWTTFMREPLWDMHVYILQHFFKSSLKYSGLLLLGSRET